MIFESTEGKAKSQTPHKEKLREHIFFFLTLKGFSKTEEAPLFCVVQDCLAPWMRGKEKCLQLNIDKNSPQIKPDNSEVGRLEYTHDPP